MSSAPGIVLSDRLEAVAELVRIAAERFGSRTLDTESIDNKSAEQRSNVMDVSSSEEIESSRIRWRSPALTKPVIADIGTDHGYLSAVLLERGIAGGVIACDVNEGPLERARETLAGYEGAQVRLCDGLSGLKSGEADIAVMAGMGGRLMMRIIEEGAPWGLGIKAMILQPQSEIYEFRLFLRKNGLQILDERSVWDAGKFYQAMLVEVGDRECREDREDTGVQIAFDRYGQSGVLRGDEALFKYIELRIDKLREIINRIPEDNLDRLAELRRELDDTETVRRIMLDL